MKKLLRVVGILIVAACVVGAGALFLLRPNPLGQPSTAQATAETATVSRGSVEQTVSATGNVAAERQAGLAFASSGRIARVLVAEGQSVKEGELLASLDTGSLEWQVTRARASLDTAVARLAQAERPAGEAELASAQAALDSALAAYDRVQAGPTDDELSSARAALDSALAAYDKVQAGPTAEDLASAQAQVDSARASLQQAQAAYDRVKDQPDITMRQESLSLQNATIEYERAEASYRAVVDRPTASDLASAAAQVAQARSQLAALQEQPTAGDLASAAAQVAQARSQLAALEEQPKAEDLAVFQAQVTEASVALDQAQAELDDAGLTAPFDGVILTLSAREGEWATPGTPAVTLAATETLLLNVNVDEVDVGQLAVGQVAHLKFNALKAVGGGLAEGSVGAVAPSSTNLGGAVAYAAEIRFEPGDLPVRLGMTADVDVVVACAGDALLVPNRAVEADREAGRYYVTRRLPDGSGLRLEVRIGLRDESMTQVVDGLAEGDVVLLPQVPGQGSTQGLPAQPGGGMFGGMRPGGGQ